MPHTDHVEIFDTDKTIIGSTSNTISKLFITNNEKLELKTKSLFQKYKSDLCKNVL